MATNNNASREERRRRIVERESDRMALITGRIQSLPPPSPPPSPSLPPHDRALHTHRINAGTEGKDGTPADSTLLKVHGASNEDVSRQNNAETGSQDGPSSCQCDTTTHTLQPHGVDGTTQVQPQFGTSIVQKAPPTDTELAITHRRARFFTSKRLNSCIVESESMRIFCGLIIAFLVVLSYVDYALFGVNLVKSESIVASRPLYIILLTDVTIVLARMILVRREDVEEERVVVPQDGHNWVEAVKLLERGLVVYQAIRGVFIDFSVYVVVVICGLSLV
ncbi:uncharacterized protein LOC110769445 [Prunus avium]|uniref:Uncharacterized protein LOC110769445 n=1 Tax=Prunus avium TaxID=42229 RepID=A0A6P5TPX0_PRUAV|nr:uncharacterized protein LOC110769445 [Prunus avium]